ncbi:hypothetical protein ACTFIT_005377 [Dictyostelium discoideum]
MGKSQQFLLLKKTTPQIITPQIITPQPPAILFKKKEFIIPDYLIIKILRYLIQDQFTPNNKDNRNNNSSNNYKTYRYKKSKTNSSRFSFLNLNFNYALVSWKWFKLTSKLNDFLPRRYLIALINRNTSNDHNYYHQLIKNQFNKYNNFLFDDGNDDNDDNYNDHDDDEEDDEEKDKNELTISKQEEKFRVKNQCIIYTSLRYGWIQFNNLVEIEFDRVSSTWFSSWQLLVKESPKLERVHLTIIVGSDNPIEIFERFSMTDIKLILKLYFNDLYCNLESIENYIHQRNKSPFSINVQSIQCICNIHQDMNWDIVKFFNPSQLLLDSNYETTFHYSYTNLLLPPPLPPPTTTTTTTTTTITTTTTTTPTTPTTTTATTTTLSLLNDFRIKFHDFLDFKDFKLALDNEGLTSLDCSLLLFDIHSFEHIIPEIGSEVYWNSISCDTNDIAFEIPFTINSIAKSLSLNTTLTTLKISDYYRYYDDDDSSIYNGYDVENAFLDKPKKLKINNNNNNTIIDPFQDTLSHYNQDIKTFAYQFSEAICLNKTLKTLYISSWDSLLADNHIKKQQQFEQLNNNNNNNNEFNCQFFKSLSINQTLTSLSLVNDTISDYDLKCLSFYFGKNHSIKQLVLSNNNLKHVDKLIQLLNSTSIRNNSGGDDDNFNNNGKIIGLTLDLSNNHYPIKSSNQIYQSILNNFKFINQLILPINFEETIEQLNQKNKFNILFN